MHFVSVFLCVCVYVCVNVSYESFAQTETKQTKQNKLANTRGQYRKIMQKPKWQKRDRNRRKQKMVHTRNEKKKQKNKRP